jgi:uncharacterized protein YjiS (DUF1127 family)
MTARTWNRPAPATEPRLFASLVARFSAWLGWLQARLDEYQRYRQTLRELESLTDRELEDIGIHRSQIREIAREAARQKA